jgi:signal transduction histidine kinase
MKTPGLERGILTIFRLFLAFQLMLILLNLHIHSNRGLIPGGALPASVAAMSAMGALFVYLSLGRLALAMGRLYLPVAILFAATFSILLDTLFLSTSLSAHPGGSAENAWQMFLYLFVPLVFVSWQYGFGQVVVYCLFTAVLDYFLARWVDPGFNTRQETHIRLLLMRSFSFMLAGYVISRIMGQLRLERKALQEANSRLSHYAGTLEELTVSRERNRMARELHDTVAHTLSGLAVHLEAVSALWTVDPGQARSMIERSLGATRSGLGETRRAIKALRASPLEDLGLVKALEDLAKETARRAGLRLELELPPDIEGLPHEAGHCFYRIGQEAMENTVRHSNARALAVRLSGGSANLSMEIRDDGKGFDPGTVDDEKCFGLRGMRERAELIHASLRIESGLGKGTVLSLSWQQGGDMGGAR